MWLFLLPSLEAFNTYLLNICCTLGIGFIEASEAHFLFLRTQAAVSYLWFCFPQLQLSVVNCSMKILNKSFQKLIFHNFQIACPFE